MSDPSDDFRETEAKWRTTLAREPDNPAVALYEVGVIAPRADRRHEAYLVSAWGLDCVREARHCRCRVTYARRP